MKNSFPGYYRPTLEELQGLWSNCIFVFDTNMLCNLYRYSETTQHEFLSTVKQLKEKNSIWLPHQAGYEFLDRRLSIIDGQAKQYTILEDAIAQIEKNLKNDRQHPYLPQKNLKKLSNAFNKALKELQKKRTEIESLQTDDPILDSVTNLFEGNVGTQFTKEELASIYKEGEQRFAEKIPPGWKDSSKDKKDENSEEESEDKKETKVKSYRRFGDLVLWFQVIEKGKTERRNIIFVTDDRKEDWWLKYKGKTFGPRPELIQEFMSQTHQKFYMYQSDNFLEYAKEHLKFPIKEETIQEVKDLRLTEENVLNLGIDLFNNLYSKDKVLTQNLINSIAFTPSVLQTLQSLSPRIDGIVNANPSTLLTLNPEIENYFGNKSSPFSDTISTVIFPPKKTEEEKK